MAARRRRLRVRLSDVSMDGSTSGASLVSWLNALFEVCILYIKIIETDIL